MEKRGGRQGTGSQVDDIIIVVVVCLPTVKSASLDYVTRHDGRVFSPAATKRLCCCKYGIARAQQRGIRDKKRRNDQTGWSCFDQHAPLRGRGI